MDEEIKKLKIVKNPRAKALNYRLGMISVFPKNATFATQNDDEKIVIILRKHIVENIPWIIRTIFLIILPYLVFMILYSFDHFINQDGLLTTQVLQIIGSHFLLIFGLYYFYFSFVITLAFFDFINWYFDIFIITNQRYISIDFSIVKGRSIVDIPLTDIVDISEKVYGFFPSIFGYGNIVFKTTSEKTSHINNVPQTIWLRDSLSDLIRYIRRIKVVKTKDGDESNLIVLSSQDGSNQKEYQFDEVEISDGTSKTKEREDKESKNKAVMTDIVGEIITHDTKNKETDKRKDKVNSNSLEP